MAESLFPWSSKVKEIALEVGALIAQKERQAAMRCAMHGSGLLLRDPSDALRLALRAEVFKQFSSQGDSYQGKDFECVDYQLYELVPNLPLFRGPPLSSEILGRGDYFCVMGAAQTFGRLVDRHWPRVLSEAVGLPVLNLARGGVGPEFFLDPQLIRYARNARFVVLQVMSGRSVGCDEYPGGRHVTRGGKQREHRKDILEGIWNEDRRLALSYVIRWNENYLKLYAKLRDLIDVPILLIWISNRRPKDWKPKILLKKLKWGPFPQLVGGKLYGDVAALFDDRYELLTQSSKEPTRSRVTGEPCPYFGDGGATFHTDSKYYPTSDSHARLVEDLVPWARGVLARGNATHTVEGTVLEEALT